MRLYCEGLRNNMVEKAEYNKVVGKGEKKVMELEN